MRVAILGAYQTKFGELWDLSLGDLIARSIEGVLRDSGIGKKQLQIGFFGNKLSSEVTGQNHVAALATEILGIPIPFIRVEAACASGGVAVSQAYMAIASGQYETALVVGAEKMTDLNPSKISDALMGAASEQERQAGLSFVGLYALMARKYLSDFEAKEEDLAQVSVKNHHHASLNPKAQFPFPISLQQVMESAPVAEPLKILDCSPITDGAAALVLTSEKFARRYRKRKIYIAGSSLMAETLSLGKRKSLTEIRTTRLAAKKAFSQAAMEPKDISLAEVHDCFSIAEILALEDLGFYKKGEGFIAERNGEVKLDGKRPINLSGGLKACGHPVGATGVKQIVEIYNQLLGRGGQRQAKKVRTALSHNVGGTGGTAVVHILKR